MKWLCWKQTVWHENVRCTRNAESTTQSVQNLLNISRFARRAAEVFFYFMFIFSKQPVHIHQLSGSMKVFVFHGPNHFGRTHYYLATKTPSLCLRNDEEQCLSGPLPAPLYLSSLQIFVPTARTKGALKRVEGALEQCSVGLLAVLLWGQIMAADSQVTETHEQVAHSRMTAFMLWPAWSW